MKKLKGGRSTLLLNPSTYRLPLRYFFAVLVGYCVDFAIYAVLAGFGVSIYWANAAGFCVGLSVNVILIRTLVFPDSRFRLHTDLQLSFISSGLMFGLGMAILWMLVELLFMNIYVAKILTNGITFVANYLIRAVFFRKKISVF